MMNRSTLILLAVAGALAMMAFAPRAFAFAGGQAAQSATSKPRIYAVKQKAMKLSPIMVHGRHMPLLLALQLYKKALTRPWSSERSDRHKLVCRWRSPVGTHFQYLRCETNREHQRQYTHLQIASAGAQGGVYKALLAGRIPVAAAGITFQKQIPRGPMEALLKKLPPADASYTLRVIGNNGKPLIDYVIKNGNLVRIKEYVYKNGKSKKH